MESESQDLKQSKRRREMLSATLRLLRKHGAGITTAQIAQEAHCSKETLYNWFGDRDGILMALVKEQTASMNLVLAASFQKEEGALEARLKKAATLLLDLLTGDAALAVNRIAMAQACRENSELGQTLLEEWRVQVAEPFMALFQEGNRSGEFAVHSPDEAFENFVGLLIGDRQRKLLLGADTRPSPAGMSAVAAKAVDRWLILYRT